MKPEINAATEFLSRIFLAHDDISKEKVGEFKQHLAAVLEERFQDHWHESCPTKGQAYRCIRVCPEEPLDPILEKVCNDVGISVTDFNLPFELTLWVDPTEVVCKFGDLKCSYHTVAKKDQTSGNLNNQADSLDIEDLLENARELYQKKQTVVTHPVHSSEMHVTNMYPDGSPNGVTMAIRINGTMHYNMPGSPPLGQDGSPRGKCKPPHSAHNKRGGYHYFGKSSGGKGAYVPNGVTNAGSMSTHGYYHPRAHNHHQQHNHHHNHHHHQVNNGTHAPNLSLAYSNGYLNGYSEDNGYGYEQTSASSPTTKMGSLPALGGGVPVSQVSPTPEQIQQQMQHPPPIPHLHQAFPHPPADTSSINLPQLPPPPPPPSSTAAISSSTNTTIINSNIISGSSSSKPSSSSSSSSKYHNIRSMSSRNKQSSPVKDAK